MSELTLDKQSIELIATALAAKLKAELSTDRSEPDGWMDTDAAAAYLGMTVSALHQLTARDAIPFSQEKPNAKCYFLRSRLDRWRDAYSQGPEV